MELSKKKQIHKGFSRGMPTYSYGAGDSLHLFRSSTLGCIQFSQITLEGRNNSMQVTPTILKSMETYLTTFFTMNTFCQSPCPRNLSHSVKRKSPNGLCFLTPRFHFLPSSCRNTLVGQTKIHQGAQSPLQPQKLPLVPIV